jgi:hypothetical protein
MGRAYEVAIRTIIFLGEGKSSVEALLTHLLPCYDGSIFNLYEEQREEVNTVLDALLRSTWF